MAGVAMDLRDLDSLSLVELLAIAEGDCHIDGTDLFLSCSTSAEFVRHERSFPQHPPKKPAIPGLCCLRGETSRGSGLLPRGAAPAPSRRGGRLDGLLVVRDRRLD